MSGTVMASSLDVMNSPYVRNCYGESPLNSESALCPWKLLWWCDLSVPFHCPVRTGSSPPPPPPLVSHPASTTSAYMAIPSNPPLSCVSWCVIVGIDRFSTDSEFMGVGVVRLHDIVAMMVVAAHSLSMASPCGPCHYLCCGHMPKAC